MFNSIIFFLLSTFNLTYSHYKRVVIYTSLFLRIYDKMNANGPSRASGRCCFLIHWEPLHTL